MYASFKVLEEQNHEDAVQWFMYWVTYATIAVVEKLFHGQQLIWLPLYYTIRPLYYTIRLVFTVWLFLPCTRGASRIYHSFEPGTQKRIHAFLARSMEAAT